MARKALQPTLREVGLNYAIAQEKIIADLIRPTDDLDTYGRCLTGLEDYWRLADQPKAAPWVRIAAVAAQYDAARADAALRMGTRAAFTYGYHKDMTVNAAIQALRVVGGSLGTELTDAALRLAIALGVVDRVTDHDHVNDNAGDLVAVLARFDEPLAARVGLALQCKLSEQMRRTSIAQALVQEGLDTADLRGRLRSAAPALELGRVRAAVTSPSSGGDVRPFEELLAAFDAAPQLEERGTLLEALTAAASDRASIQQVAQRVPAGRRGRFEMTRLARRAAELEEHNIAYDLALRSVSSGEPLLYGYWDGGETAALVLMCQLKSSRARPTFARAVQDAIEHRYGIGFASMPVLCECLWALNEPDAARAILSALLDHLDAVTAIYPREASSWRAAVGLAE